MTMDDQHIDGNGIAGVLGEVAGAEMSAVLRCPACEDVGVVLGVQEKRIVVEWRGSTRSRGEPRPQIQLRRLNWRYSAIPRNAMRARASG